MPVGASQRSLMAAAGVAASAPWELIASTTLASSAASISFASIDSKYKIFRLTAYSTGDGAGGAYYGNVVARFNNDSGTTNYVWEGLGGSTTSVIMTRNTQAHIAITHGNVVETGHNVTLEMVVAKQVAGSAAMVLSKAATISYTGTGGVLQLKHTAGVWNNTADPINRIDLVSNIGGSTFDTGTVAVLEGLAD